MNNKPIVHIVPVNDIGTNHRQHSDCPCSPTAKRMKAFGVDSIVYAHKYLDGYQDVKKLCQEVGIKMQPSQYKAIRANGRP
jgi:deoxycytidylate deaminase